jgi:hypothetical protein
MIAMNEAGAAQMKIGVIPTALGVALLLIAVATLARRKLRSASLNLKKDHGPLIAHWQAPMTVLCGYFGRDSHPDVQRRWARR